MVTSVGVDYSYLRELVFGHSRNVLDPSCDYLFDTRLGRVLRDQGMIHLQQLVEYLRTRRDPSLERTIAEAMTINETSFFRDTRPFELLRTAILPRLIEERRTRRSLRIWSAACSTGQEALSLAILIRENFPALAGWDIRIEGTDISCEVVERARTARYHRIEMNRGLPARLLVRYFDHIGEDWIAKPDIRALCSFRQANLCAVPLPFREPFDIILLRNVMLYFTKDTRKTLLSGVHKLLARDGVLFLGSSEQPADPKLWSPVLEGGTCHYQPRHPA
jgi:chemotaxis protein methyltransferase CheR